MVENLNGAVHNGISAWKSEKVHINLENCDHDNFNVFVDDLLHENRYKRQDIDNILETLNVMNGEKFIDIKRAQFVKILKTNPIKGTMASKVYKLIDLPTHDNNYNYSTEINSSIDCSNNTISTVNGDNNGIIYEINIK